MRGVYDPHKKWSLVHLYLSKNFHNLYCLYVIFTQICVSTKYTRLKFKFRRLPTLWLFTLMNVLLHVFAYDGARCFIQPHLLLPPCFNLSWKLSKVRSHFIFLMPFPFKFLVFHWSTHFCKITSNREYKFQFQLRLFQLWAT